MVGMSRVGIHEGNYASWTFQWEHLIPGGFKTAMYGNVWIDEKQQRLAMAWYDPSNDNRFGVFNLSDFSTVFLSTDGVDYTRDYPSCYSAYCFSRGMVDLDNGGISPSILSYLLLLRNDYYTIEVWRSGTALVWSRHVGSDFHMNQPDIMGGLISQQGRYIALIVEDWVASPATHHVLLYKA